MALLSYTTLRDTTAQAALERDLVALVDKFNDASDGTMVVRSEYLEAVITTA